VILGVSFFWRANAENWNGASLKFAVCFALGFAYMFASPWLGSEGKQYFAILLAFLAFAYLVLKSGK
jgi:hypothetical protein